ncbi:MAG: hypothetical protein FJ253_08720 [Phycisphaerae bacterium]|nr:hypothetical protein [Phycisphaerae bacterium]
MRTRNSTQRIVIGAVVATAALALSGATALVRAAPQDALGDGRGLEHPANRGRALDQNLRHGSGGSNDRFVEEDLRARNLVVTGNVAGGRGFRGNVGYTADRDFRGASSDDTTYDFRAGSAYSDPRIARAGSMGDRLEVGRSYGNVEFARSPIRGSLLGGENVNGTRLLFDQAAARMLTPEARRSMMDLSTVASVTNAEGQKVRVMTGGFRGVAATIDSDAVDGLELGLYDTARLKQDLRDGTIDKELRGLRYRNPLEPGSLGAPDGELDDPLKPLPGEVDTRIGATRIDTGIKSMDSILGEVERRVAERAARDRPLAPEPAPGVSTRPTDPNAPPVDPNAAPSGATTTPDRDVERTPEQKAWDDFVKEVEDLRSTLRGETDAAPPDAARPGADRGDGARPSSAVGAIDGDRTGTRDAAAGIGDGDATKPLTGVDRVKARERAIDELVELLRHGKPIENASENAVARVAEILQSAESAMSRQAFFLAEQHYTTALMLTPNNPLAKMGLVNAQLGAGLLSSAAITLREVYITNPELIDARISPTLLPPRERMRSLLERLQETKIDARNASDVGLLSAYLGRQLDDRTAIEQGLTTLDGAGSADAAMARLLRGIWLAPPKADEPAAEPAAAPANAPAPAP